MAGKRQTEARRWYLQAVFDLEAAQWNVTGEFYNTACFLAQQAAEKALKALLYYLGARKAALLTHSLATMVTYLSKEAPEWRNCLEEARQLDLHYVPSRYPNGLPDGIPHLFYGASTAQAALAAAQEIIGKVRHQFVAEGQTDILAPPAES